METERFAPDQFVSARDLQRSVAAVLDRLAVHGSLLVFRHGKPVAILIASPSTQDDDKQGGSDAADHA
jgi:antitoxin (DNA-binding transcriptional repressor) of toxin-antitoxin stability system